MANDDLKIIVKTILSTDVKDIEQQVKALSSQIKERLELKLKINAEDLQLVSRQVDEFHKKLKTKTFVKGSQFINVEVENQAFSQITARIRELRRNVDELAKVDISTGKKGEIKTATLTYYNKELGQTVTETMGWSQAQKKVNDELVKMRTFETQGFKYSDDMAKARKNADNATIAQKKLNDQLDLYKQKMLGGGGFKGELDIFAEKNVGRYNKSALSQLRDDVENLNINTPELNNKMKQTTTQFSSLKNQAEKTSNVFSNMFENAYKFLRFYLVGGILVEFIGSLGQGLEILRQIDDELISIAKVTEYTKKEMELLVDSGISISKEYGRSVQEYLSAVAEFSRAGFGQAAQQYAELSLLLQNVGELTSEQANKTLIATDAAFQLQGNYTSLMRVIDKFNHVANLNATTIKKVAEGMQVAGSVFHNAGLSIDQATALIGTATATTQRSGTEIARAWRTILMRIMRQIDEDADSTVDSIAKAEEALLSIGIPIRETPTKWRPIFDVLTDLGNKFDTLTDTQKSFVMESLAGLRQANVLVSTMQNWSMVNKQLEESINSEGSALRENEIYIQSWTAKIKQLGSSLTSLYNNLLNTDSIKSFISILDSLIVILDKLINNQFSSAIIQIGVLSFALTALGKGFIAILPKIIAYTTGITTATIATKGLTAALLASPLFWVVVATATIYAIVKAIDYLSDYLSSSLERQKNIVRDLTTEIKNLDSEFLQLKALEERTEKQENYLRLLEREIELKNDLREIEVKKLIKQEFFDIKEMGKPIATMAAGSEIIPDKSGIDLVYEQIDALKDLREEQSLLSAENEDSTESWKDLEKQILEHEQALVDVLKTINEYDLDNINFDNLSNEEKEWIRRLKTLAKGIEFNLGLLKKQADETDKSAESTFDLDQNLIQLKESTANLINDLDELAKAYNTLNEGNQLSAKQIIDLVTSFDELEIQIDETTGMIYLEKDAILEVMKTREEAQKAQIEQWKQEAIGVRDSLLEKLSSYGDEIRSIQDVIDARQKLADTYSNSKLIGDSGLYGDEFIGGAFGFYDDAIDELNAIENRIKNYDILNRANLSGQARKDASSSTKSFIESIFDRFPHYQEQIQDLLNSLNSIGGLQSEISAIEFDIKMAEILEDTEKLIELQGQLLIKRQEEIKQLEVIDYKLKNMQVTIGNEFTKEFADTFKDIKQRYVDEFKDIETPDIFKFTEEQKAIIETDIKERIHNIETQISKGEIGETAGKKIVQGLESELKKFNFYDAVATNLLKEMESIGKQIPDKLIQVKELRKKLADDIINTIKDAYRKMKDLEIARIDETLRALKEEHDKRMGYLDEEVSKYEEVINARLKSMDRENEGEDFNKQLTKLQQERAELQKQINVLSMDDSLEARAKLSELNKQLASTDEKIEELMLARTRELRKQNLQDNLNDYKKEVEAKRKSAQDEFEIEQRKLEKERREIEWHYNELLANEREFARMREDIINGNVDAVQLKLQSFLDEFEKYNDKTAQAIGQSWQELLSLMNKVSIAQSGAGAIKTASTSGTSGTGGTSGTTTASWGTPIGTLYDHQYYLKNNTAYAHSRLIAGILGIDDIQFMPESESVKIGGVVFPYDKYENGMTYVGVRDVAETFNRKVRWTGDSIEIYHEGGIAGDQRSGISRFINDLFQKDLNPNEILAKLKLGEVVVEPMSGFRNLQNNFGNLVSQMVRNLKPQVIAGGNTYITNIDVDIDKLTGGKEGAREFFKYIDTEKKKKGLVGGD